MVCDDPRPVAVVGRPSGPSSSEGVESAVLFASPDAPVPREVDVAPASPGPAGGQPKTWLWVTCTAIVVILIGAAVLVALRPSTDTNATAPSSTLSAPSAPGGAEGREATTTRVTTSTSTIRTSTTTTTPRATTTTALRTTTTSRPPQTTTTVQNDVSVDGAPMDSWVAMLGALPSEAEAEAELAKLASVAPGLQIALSDNIPSLVPGWWVVYVPTFPSGEAAIDYCWSIGRGHRDKCYASYFSRDPDDRSRRIFP